MIDYDGYDLDGYPVADLLLADCKAGKHVPAGITDKRGKIIEVICQNCATELTIADWETYFGRKISDSRQ